MPNRPRTFKDTEIRDAAKYASENNVRVIMRPGEMEFIPPNHRVITGPVEVQPEESEYDALVDFQKVLDARRGKGSA